MPLGTFIPGVVMSQDNAQHKLSQDPCITIRYMCGVSPTRALRSRVGLQHLRRSETRCSAMLLTPIDGDVGGFHRGPSRLLTVAQPWMRLHRRFSGGGNRSVGWRKHCGSLFHERTQGELPCVSFP